MTRKLQRLASAMLCLAMLFLMTATAFASPAPHELITKCPKCGFGKVSVSRRTVKDGSPYPMPHEFTGHDDLWQDYKFIHEQYCNSCDYSYQYEEFAYTEMIYCPLDG